MVDVGHREEGGKERWRLIGGCGHREEGGEGEMVLNYHPYA